MEQIKRQKLFRALLGLLDYDKVFMKNMKDKVQEMLKKQEAK